MQKTEQMANRASQQEYNTVANVLNGIITRAACMSNQSARASIGHYALTLIYHLELGPGPCTNAMHIVNENEEIVVVPRVQQRK